MKDKIKAYLSEKLTHSINIRITVLITQKKLIKGSLYEYKT